MIKLVCGIAFLACAGGAASGQTTNCYVNGQNVNCRTNPAPTNPALNVAPPPPIFVPSPNNTMQQFQAIQQIQAMRAQQAADERARVEAGNREYFAKRAGEMVAAGKCDDAREYALENGQFDLEKSVREACAPR